MRFLWVLAVGAACLTGCSGYKLGPTGGQRAGEKSIQVAAPQNKTYEPLLVADLSHALRKQLQRDGTYKLDTKGEADVILYTEIVRYDRHEVAFQPRDTLTARDYEVRVYAKALAVDRATGKRLLDREMRGRTTVRIGSDLQNAERQARPLLMEDLARNITHALVDGDW